MLGVCGWLMRRNAVKVARAWMADYRNEKVVEEMRMAADWVSAVKSMAKTADYVEYRVSLLRGSHPEARKAAERVMQARIRASRGRPVDVDTIDIPWPCTFGAMLWMVRGLPEQAGKRRLYYFERKSGRGGINKERKEMEQFKVIVRRTQFAHVTLNAECEEDALDIARSLAARRDIDDNWFTSGVSAERVPEFNDMRASGGTCTVCGFALDPDRMAYHEDLGPVCMSCSASLVAHASESVERNEEVES